MAWPHPDTEFTDNYSTTCLLQYHNLFLSHSVLTKHLLPALDLRSAFLMPKPENFTHFHNETNCVRPKKTATFPPLVAVSLTVLTLNVHPINKTFYTSISVHWNEASLCLAQQCAKKEVCGMSCKGILEALKTLMAHRHQHTAPGDNLWCHLTCKYSQKRAFLVYRVEADEGENRIQHS